MTLGNRDLFFGDVTRQANHLHTVEQRPRNRVQRVGRADEQHFGQVQAQIQVMVEEIDVLFRIKGFEQGRGRVALEALTHLVDLVEHDDRVHHFDVFEGLHQLARLGADVRATMAFDLGFVTHAADTEAVERSSQGLGDRLADAGFTHARRADQQHDRTAYRPLVGADCQKFEDAVFDVVEPRMVGVEHLAGMLEVEFVLPEHTPGQRRCPVQVVAGDRVFGRPGFQDRQFVHFLIDAFLRLSREGFAFKALLELLDVRAAVVFGQAQFLLDHLELFFEEELALMLADFQVHFGGNFFLQARDFDFLAQHRQNFLHAFEHGHAIEHFLQLVAGCRGQRGREIGQRRRVVGAEAIEVVFQLFAVQRVERQQLLDGIDQRHAVSLHLIGGLFGLLRVFDFHQIRRAVVFEPHADAHTGQALGHELQFAVFAAGVMHFHQRAVFREAGGVEMARVIRWRIDKKQGQRVMR